MVMLILKGERMSKKLKLGTKVVVENNFGYGA